MASNYSRAAEWLLNSPRRADRTLARLARRKKSCVVGIGLLTVVVRLALIPVLGVPEPKGHDEYGYLLAADTFAHGRLANPTHPMWIHFESFHIIQKPTYSSIYPPAQGLVLAAGQLLGHPWVGQLLITALMCAAICWMLQGWLPPKWALYGAIVAFLRLAVLSYWMNGYWSASVVALGGALLLGALPRIKQHQRIGDAFWLAVGVAILANSRPYEGLVLSSAVGLALLFWMFGPDRPPPRVSFARIVAPASIVLGFAVLATGYFYLRVTGSPFQMTYLVDSQTYNPVPFFLWQRPGPQPAYHHETLRQFYELDLKSYFEHREAFWDFCKYRATVLWLFYLEAFLTIPLLLAPWLWRDRGMRVVLITGVLFVLASLGETWALPHYAAPATGLLFLIVAQGSRRIALLKWAGLRVGRVAALAIPVLVGAALVSRIAAPTEIWPRGNLQRAALMNQMEAIPGKHLVVVSYAPLHDTDKEWVYNQADIDAAKVVWARDMGVEKNRALLRYFGDRTAWAIVVSDGQAPVLTRYGPNAPP